MRGDERSVGEEDLRRLWIRYSEEFSRSIPINQVGEHLESLRAAFLAWLERTGVPIDVSDTVPGRPRLEGVSLAHVGDSVEITVSLSAGDRRAEGTETGLISQILPTCARATVQALKQLVPDFDLKPDRAYSVNLPATQSEVMAVVILKGPSTPDAPVMHIGACKSSFHTPLGIARATLDAANRYIERDKRFLRGRLQATEQQ